MAKLPLLVWLAVKLRNQALCVIAHAVAPNWFSPEKNGEYALLERAKTNIRSFVDVGANVGDWTGAMLARGNPDARGLLIEPNPEAVSILRQRFGARQGIEITEAAASDHDGTTRFFCEADCGGGSSVVQGATAFSRRAFDVKTFRLDSLLAQIGWESVDFIKVDAEGHDFTVLSGARRLLERQAVGLIQFEYNASWAMNGSTIGHCVEYLRRFGYESRLLQPDRIIPFNYQFFGEYFRYSNFIAGTKGSFAELGIR